MKKHLLLLTGISFSISFISFGQNATMISHQNSSQQERCGIMQNETYLEQQDPNRAGMRASFEQNLQSYIAAHPGLENSRSVMTIPVVVHLVYKTAAQNISDGQIQSQITVLNQDWTRTNPDASNTPAVWTSIAANIGVNFCLATVDPSGNSTTGIERRNTTITSFSQNNNVKHFSSGGLDIWDPNNYLNIWVCNLGAGLLGYGEFPLVNTTSTFGVVIHYSVFGSSAIYPSGTYLAGYDLGRTTTHEFSHCFDLLHIWGDDGGACTGNDYCMDTPNQADATFGSPSGVVTDACSPSSPGIMYENYMDYSDDAVMNLFTNNQKTRILAVLNTAPYNTLQLSNRCGTVAVQELSMLGAFSVHPNPSNGKFTISFSNSNFSDIDIHVLNVVGQEVFNEHLDALNNNEVDIDLTGNADGVYFIQVSDKKDKVTRKIVVQ
ncbi:MAG: T9SS type A sorting domain-containing protein [Bacteroidetes bacterium]|nr:T9SS type A sorting domain-containing protein [Bacteroidota bacterium]